MLLPVLFALLRWSFCIFRHSYSLKQLSVRTYFQQNALFFRFPVAACNAGLLRLEKKKKTACADERIENFCTEFVETDCSKRTTASRAGGRLQAPRDVCARAMCVLARRWRLKGKSLAAAHAYSLAPESKREENEHGEAGGMSPVRMRGKTLRCVYSSAMRCSPWSRRNSSRGRV